MPLTTAERQRAYISRLKAGIGTAPNPRKPMDRRSKPQRWPDTIGELLNLLDSFQYARENLPDRSGRDTLRAEIRRRS
jgi:hypothetical protein